MSLADLTPPPSAPVSFASGVAPSCQGAEDRYSFDEIHHADGRVFRPPTTASLAALLRDLSHEPRPPRVTVRGGGQALDAQALNDDVVIELAGPELGRIEEPQRDADGYHITVGAAATWGDILTKTSAHGLLPYSVVTTSHATAGGTMAADCLSRCSPLTGREGTHVRAFELMTVDGRRVRCRRHDPDPERAELFRAVIGGFGYLGVVTELTFDLRPPLPGWAAGKPIRVATRVDTQVVETPFEARWSRFLSVLRERTLGEELAEGHDGLVYKLRHAEEKPGAPIPLDAVSAATWYALGGVEGLLFRSRYVLDREVHPTPLYQKVNDVLGVLSRGMTNPTLTEMGEGALFLFCPPGVYVDELADFTFFMENQVSALRASATAAGFRFNTVQQTFVLPAQSTPDDPAGVGPTERFLAQVHDPGSPTFLDPLRPTLFDLMYLPADDFLMSATRGMAGYAVTLTFVERDAAGWEALRARLRVLSARCAALGGRVHLIKNVEAEPADLARMYGDATSRFLALKQRYDPMGMLENEFFARVFRAA